MNPSDPSPLREQIDSLPREVPPARDLWPEIASQLQVERVDPNALKPARSTSRRRYFPLALSAGLALAAGLAVAVGLRWFRPVVPPTTWDVTPLTGSPQVNRTAVTGPARLAVGQWLETDASSRATLFVGAIGEIRLEPNSRVRLVNATAEDHRIELKRGTMSALIWAPPRLFFVETPAATAIDLGCAYTLTVDDHGAGRLRVTAGYVAFEHSGRQTLIPAGLVCLTRPGHGPGTPFVENTALREALQRFDFAAGGATALAEILAQATSSDGITLWHLLESVTADQRGAVFDKLAAWHPPPAGVTREGIVAGEKSMLTLWGLELGLRLILGPG